MLLKFFTNSHSTAYLRSLAEEFGESTNSIRHELNNLSKAGYLLFNEDGRTIVYRANTSHPLYNEVRNLVHKYLGIDKIIENIVKRVGDLQAAFIVADYAEGKDSGRIDLVLIGMVDDKYLEKLISKAEKMLQREIKVEVISLEIYNKQKENYKTALLIWKKD